MMAGWGQDEPIRIVRKRAAHGTRTRSSSGAYLLGRLVRAVDSGRLEAEPSVTERLRAGLDNL